MYESEKVGHSSKKVEAIQSRHLSVDIKYSNVLIDINKL